jgi:subtilisin family serine protease
MIASVLALVAALIIQSPVLESQARPGEPPIVRVNGHDAVAGEVLVQFSSEPGAAGREMMAAQIDAAENTAVGRRGLRRFRSRSFDVETLLEYFRSQPGVEYAEPNYIVRAIATPNDPQFPNLWGLLNTGQPIQGIFGVAGADIDAVPAWDVSTGSTANVVAIIDSGIDYTHPDLAANIWSAPAPFTVTIGGVPITCPAGSHGFNAITRTCDPMDDNNHGTHVAGTIGAVGNNGVGVTGVNWTASMIGGKFLNSSGNGTTAAAIDTIDFLIQVKAAFAGTGGANIRVLNNSWGGGGFSLALQTAISNANANDMLFVAAAGNNSNNNDVFPFYPAGYNVANVVSVAATNNSDLLAWFSNYGASTVDLAAPGEAILSTTIGNTYRYFNGTSMATPHVAGAAALMLSECTLTTAALKSAILSNVDPLGSLTGVVDTGGRLNVDRAIRSCGGGPSVPAVPGGLSAIPGNAQVSLAWNVAAGASTYSVKRSTTPGGPYAAIASGLTDRTYVDGGLTNGLTYYYVVSAVNAEGESGNSAPASATPFAYLPTKPLKLKAAPGDSRVSLSWQPSSYATSYNVKRSLAKAGPYVLIQNVAGTSAVDLTVTNGVKYFYAVTGVNSAGESGLSNKASATPAPVPAPPAGVSAATGPNTGEVVLTWNASAWATSYRVKRSATAGGPYSSVKKLTSLAFTDVNRTSGKRYYYVITSINASGESGPSLEVSAIAK